MIDTSGSMMASSRGSNVIFLNIAVSLGLYLAEKNEGSFKDVVVEFSSEATLHKLKGGDIIEKLNKMNQLNWGMSTNLHAVFDRVLKLAVKNDVPVSHMPEMIIIFSDMQFNQCVRNDDSAIKMIERKYSEQGYPVPKVVFWNLHDYGNVPVKFSKNGVALVSGFSPNLMTSLLSDNLEKFTPYNIMMETIMKPRYDHGLEF